VAATSRKGLPTRGEQRIGVTLSDRGDSRFHLEIKAS
jgi:hypothetical protein